MMNPKISVIVPVYNTERYLAKCLDSLVSQTLNEIEIILIDDASTDASTLILQTYAQKDNRIRLVTYESPKGPGGARNAGLALAKGTYIAFVDSDDWLDTGAFAVLCEKMDKEQVDILGFGYRFVNAQNKVTSVRSKTQTYTGTEALRAYLLQEIPIAVWNKMYKREMLLQNTPLFASDCYYEDMVATFRVLATCKRFMEIPEVFYNYVEHQGSIMRSFSLRHIADYKRSFEDLKAFHQSLNLPYPEELHAFLVKHAANAYKQILEREDKDLFADYVSQLPEFAVQGMHLVALQNQKNVKNIQTLLAYDVQHLSKWALLFICCIFHLQQIARMLKNKFIK
jgi:glycosyltransferase involved in cell wall biosynthesis